MPEHVFIGAWGRRDLKGLMRNLAPWLLLLTAGCNVTPVVNDSVNAVQSATDSSQNVAGVDAGLEQAAVGTGLVVDVSKVQPTGLYQHSHEGGRDRLCVVPSKNGQFRFGMEAVFGDTTVCTGRGKAKRAGDKLIFDFERSTCLIVGSYEGDRVSLPGALDISCDDLCNDRGSFEGVSFPRVSEDIAKALKASSRSGALLCAGQ